MKPKTDAVEVVLESDPRNEIATQDFWNNPITIRRISSGDFSCRTLTKTFANPSNRMTEEQLRLFRCVLKNLRSPYLQVCEPDAAAETLRATFDYDTRDFESLLERMRNKGKSINQRQVMVVLRALIDLGATFENNFCHLFEVSLSALKVFPMQQQFLAESLHGFRLQNPFLNDEYLAEIIQVE